MNSATELSTGQPAARYTRVAVALHWTMALMIAGSFTLGLYMTGLPVSVQKLKLYSWHKWAGVVLLLLSVARLTWRLSHPVPLAPPMARWQARAAHVAHMALYGLFFAVPMLGWAYSSAAGIPVVLFGLLPLPDVLAPDRQLAVALRPWHGRAAWLLAILAVLHVAGALKHQFVDRDNLLTRMT